MHAIEENENENERHCAVLSLQIEFCLPAEVEKAKEPLLKVRPFNQCVVDT